MMKMKYYSLKKCCYFFRIIHLTLGSKLIDVPEVEKQDALIQAHTTHPKNYEVESSTPKM